MSCMIDQTTHIKYISFIKKFAQIKKMKYLYFSSVCILVKFILLVNPKQKTLNTVHLRIY